MKCLNSLFIVLAAAMIISSCGSTKNVAYFKNSDSVCQDNAKGSAHNYRKHHRSRCLHTLQSAPAECLYSRQDGKLWRWNRYAISGG